MRGSSPRMTTVPRAVLNWRRHRPRPLRAAQALERLRHSEHAEIVEAAADDLHADRKTAATNAAMYRDGRIFRHVPRHGVADVLERLVGIVYRRGYLGCEIHHWRHRRDHIVDIGKQLCRRRSN